MIETPSEHMTIVIGRRTSRSINPNSIPLNVERDRTWYTIRENEQSRKHGRHGRETQQKTDTGDESEFTNP